MSIENKLIKRNAILATGAFAIGIAGVAGCAPKQEQSTQTNIPEKQTTATMPSQGNVIETPTAIFTLTPVIPESTPTRVVATSTPTKETSPKSENLMPKYGVFFGDIVDQKTKLKVAEVVFSLIPLKNSQDEIFFYYITSKNSAGSRTHAAKQLSPTWVEKDIHFQIGVYKDEVRGVDAKYNEKTKKLEGILYNINSDAKFDLNLVGTGKDAVLKAMEKVIKDQSSDQPTTAQKELDFYLGNKLNSWQ